MICASLLLFCNPYFPWCYSDLLFSTYMYYCIYLYLYMCILHIYILHICKYIHYCRVLATNNAGFAKSFMEGHICSSSKMCSEEMLEGLSELVTASSFSACPVLSCFAPQLKLQHKISLWTLYGSNLWSWLWSLRDHVPARNHHSKDTVHLRSEFPNLSFA